MLRLGMIMEVKKSYCVLLMVISFGCAISPQSKEAKYLKRGQAQMAKRDYSRAILEFLTAAQVMPKDAEPYYQLGLAYLESRNVASAVGAFRQATQLNPQHAGANLKLAELMTVSRDKDLALDLDNTRKAQDLFAAATRPLSTT